MLYSQQVCRYYYYRFRNIYLNNSGKFALNVAQKRDFNFGRPDSVWISQLREIILNYTVRLTRLLSGNIFWTASQKLYKMPTFHFFHPTSQNQNNVPLKFLGFGRRLVNRAREMLLSAACVSVYNGGDEKNHQNDIEQHFSDLDYIQELTQDTLMCRSCHKRLTVDRQVPNIVYCSCGDGKAMRAESHPWKPFVERSSTLVWRKEHEIFKGLYAYKMYGRFEDVSALSFVRVQLDTNYRKHWDPSAVELMVVAVDKDKSSDTVYWEMQWPKPFANRDYVFQRQLSYNAKKRICIISNVATRHPSFPPKKSLHRVTEYWSFMVVKPLQDFTQPGLEFVLTYFDHPGLSIPSAVASWVAMTGMPDFVGRLHEAAKNVSNLPEENLFLFQLLLQQLTTEEEAQLDHETLSDRWVATDETKQSSDCNPVKMPGQNYPNPNTSMSGHCHNRLDNSHILPSPIYT